TTVQGRDTEFADDDARGGHARYPAAGGILERAHGHDAGRDGPASSGRLPVPVSAERLAKLLAAHAPTAHRPDTAAVLELQQGRQRIPRHLLLVVVRRPLLRAAGDGAAGHPPERLQREGSACEHDERTLLDGAR